MKNAHTARRSPYSPIPKRQNSETGSWNTSPITKDTFPPTNALSRGQEIAAEVDEGQAVDTVSTPSAEQKQLSCQLGIIVPDRLNFDQEYGRLKDSLN
jgi:hypothetical protein